MILLLPLLGEARPSWRTHQQPLADAIGVACLGEQTSHKSMAYTLGLDPSHWSKQLLHDGPNLLRLLLMPKAWWMAFLPILAGLVKCEELLRGSEPATSEIAVLRADLAALRTTVEQELVARRTA